MLLAHPEKDLWTPVEISELFFNRLNKINKQLVILENAGHFPIESPGLQQLAVLIIIAVLFLIKVIKLKGKS